jgi:DNA-binding MarR family transcriptional regulator
MAATIEPLLAEGLVRREQDPAHGRRMLLHLTPLGVERLAEIAPRIRAVEDLIVAELDAESRENFARYLRSARHSLDSAGPRPSGRPRPTD